MCVCTCTYILVSMYTSLYRNFTWQLRQRFVAHGTLTRAPHTFEVYTICIHSTEPYGVASISRLLKILGLFCKRALQKRRYSAKETYNFKKPTNHSHPIWSLERAAGSYCENLKTRISRHSPMRVFQTSTRALLSGSWKLRVSFAKESFKRDHILQKIHIMLRSLLVVATP